MAKTVNYNVTVGPRANVFHDQTTGITVCKGETVTLRENQFKSRRVQQALNTSHLILVADPKNPTPKYTSGDVDKLNKKMKAQYEKGMEIEKMATSFTLEEAKLLAELHEVKVDEGDTVEAILKAILED